MAHLGNTIVNGNLKVLNGAQVNSISGDGSGLTALNASSISSGTLNAARLATSGATAGSYGESADKSPGYAGAFNIPYVTVDTYGRVTAIANKKITLPSADNTDTKNTTGSTDTSSKIFLVGATSQAANPQTYSHDTVFVDTNGRLNSAAPASTANDTTVATTKWVKDQSYTTATGHSHNYAGSSSAGGAATSLANFKVTTTANNAIDTPGSNAIAYASGLTKANWNYQQTDGGYYCQWYSANWWHEIFGDYRTGQISVRGNNNGTKTNWRRVLDESNYSTIIGTTYLTASSTLDATKLSGTIPASCYTDTKYTHPSAGANTGSFGPSANASPAHGGTFSVPYVTVNADGHVTAASTKTITLPAAPAGYTHPNTVTAGTAGTSSATSGSTLAVPYVTYNANGHITATGTHTHTVTGFLPSTGGTVTGNITLSNNGHIILSSGIEIY